MIWVLVKIKEAEVGEEDKEILGKTTISMAKRISTILMRGNLGKISLNNQHLSSSRSERK